MIKFRLDTDTDINLVVMEGEIYLEDILKFLDSLEPFIKGLNDLLFLYDLTDATLMISPKDVSHVSELTVKMNKNMNIVKSAFLVSEPNQTALTILFAEIKRDSRAKRAVFSTKAAAEKWLKE